MPNRTVVLSRYLSEETAKIGKNESVYQRKTRIVRHVAEWEIYVLNLFNRAPSEEVRLAMLSAAIPVLGQTLRDICAPIETSEDTVSKAIEGFITEECGKAELALIKLREVDH